MTKNSSPKYYGFPQGLTAASMLPAAPELLTVKTNFEFIQTFDRYWSSLYIFEMLSTFLLWLCTWHAFDLLWMLSKEQSLFFMIWFRSRILFPTFLQTITFFSKSAVCQTSIFGCDWGQLILKLLLIDFFLNSILEWYLHSYLIFVIFLHAHILGHENFILRKCINLRQSCAATITTEDIYFKLNKLWEESEGQGWNQTPSVK